MNVKICNTWPKSLQKKQSAYLREKIGNKEGLTMPEEAFQRQYLQLL